MQKCWQKTFEKILKTIKILRKRISSDGETKTTVFTVNYSLVIQPTHNEIFTHAILVKQCSLEMEKCPVSGSPIFEMERCITKFFGIKTYGVHVNCFFRNQDGQICLWIGRRSPTKETCPGLLDNCFAGKSFWVNMGSFKFMKVNFRWLYSRFGYYGNSC